MKILLKFCLLMVSDEGTVRSTKREKRERHVNEDRTVPVSRHSAHPFGTLRSERRKGAKGDEDTGLNHHHERSFPGLVSSFITASGLILFPSQLYRPSGPSLLPSGHPLGSLGTPAARGRVERDDRENNRHEISPVTAAGKIGWHRLTLDLWLAKDNRFLNPKSSYKRILMAPSCRFIPLLSRPVTITLRPFMSLRYATLIHSS